ncbi:MAG: cytochrome c maturation protein CcmE [Candidatus Latescibacterota bacterium]|nr:MAG: cytochrome c maturation protein CcmE [Candidatus Latescibacterota bacterium]
MMKKLKFVLAFAAAALGLSYLILMGLRGAKVYYLRVEELLSSPELWGKRVRVEGEVVPGSVKRGKNLEFQMAGGGRRVRVIHTGPVPPLFGEGKHVVVEGTYSRKEKAFLSGKILTKCPSKYEAGR